MSATERATERVQLRELVRVLRAEVAGRESEMERLRAELVKLAPAPPAETPAPKCINCHGTGRWWDTVRETYTPCAFGCYETEAPAPTPTCKWRVRLPGDGTAICDDCRDSRTVAHALLGEKARDASVDALSRCGRCDGYDACVRCGDLATIDRLRAELAAANEELSILRRLEQAVFAGDAAACSPKVPAILTEYLEWSRVAVDARRGQGAK